MDLNNLSDAKCRDIAMRYCNRNWNLYLSHEHYYHSDGKHNYLLIAVEDFSGRYEVRLDLNGEV